MDQAGVRAANLALVARTVYADADSAPTRADVAAATAMTRSTVSRLADALIEGGVLTEGAPAARTGPGRPGTPLAPDGSRFAALGLQVNVGYLAAVVVDLAGRVRSERVKVEDLRGQDPAAVLGRLARMAEDAVAEVGGDRVLVGAGLALPGIIAAGSDTLLWAPNLGWSEVDVPRLLEADALGGVRLTVGNEADLGSHTVSRVGPARPSPLRDFLYLSGETGIGGSLVVDGAHLPGRHGWAGEIGHVTVDPAGPACPCGSTGCLEQYAGKRAMLTAAGLPAETPAQVLRDRVLAGDERATSAIDTAAWALGCAVSGAINLVDLPVIVLGGHLREVADLLRPLLTATVRERVLSARWVEPTIEVAEANSAPGALGGAYRELERVIADPEPWLAARKVR